MFERITSKSLSQYFKSPLLYLERRALIFYFAVNKPMVRIDPVFIHVIEESTDTNPPVSRHRRSSSVSTGARWMPRFGITALLGVSKQ